MRVATSDEMRELDRRTIEDVGVPGVVLMDHAGKGVADAVERIIACGELHNAKVLLIAGKGNNGGDAFVAARYLAQSEYDVEVWLAFKEEDISGDASVHLKKMLDEDVPMKELPAEDDWTALADASPRYDVVVDGILGTGIKGEAHGVPAAAISAVNRLSEDGMVVAIDIPSGLDADSGAATGPTVVADVTVTMGLPKRGLLEPSAIEYAGGVEVVDIGIPPEFSDEIESDIELITPADLKPLFRRRARSTHKGSYGHALIISGAAGYSGAVTMAARAALRSGVGLVTVVTPRSIADAVAIGVPEAMVHGAEETGTGSLSASLWAHWKERIEEFNAVLMGPGMTQHDDTRALVSNALGSGAQLVLDADAINIQKRTEDLIVGVAGDVVMTPHPGELARFLGMTTAEVQSHRVACARETAQATGATVILKGAGTIVAASEQHIPAINMTGNPGMATGGTGDVLSGLLVGLLAQGMSHFDAACAAVYLHGRAGDMASWRASQPGLTATDVIEELPYVLREVSAR